MNKGCLFLLVFLGITFRLSAQEWVVPADENSRLSPFAFSDSTRKTGSVLYNTNCKSCHGDPGKNNAVKLVPMPPDPTATQMQQNTDGAIYYKLTAGRGLMPAFKNSIPSTDVWKIISFIRSYNDKYVQEVPKKLDPNSTYQEVKLQINSLKESGQIQVLLTAVKEGKRQFVPGAEVKLFAKRYFGNLQLDAAKTTDNQGYARFAIPKNLPGDSLGYVQLTARPSDDNVFGEARADTTLAIGVSTYRPPLNESRALWNVGSKAPIWLILSYSFAVLAVWGFIFYVLLLLKSIFKSGS